MPRLPLFKHPILHFKNKWLHHKCKYAQVPKGAVLGEINGVKFIEPRKTCWFGKPYGYTGVQLNENNNWDPELLKLMKRVQKFAKPGLCEILLYQIHFQSINKNI